MSDEPPAQGPIGHLIRAPAGGWIVRNPEGVDVHTFTPSFTRADVQKILHRAGMSLLPDDTVEWGL